MPELCTNNNPNEGEFLFVKVKISKGSRKTIIVGNMYKSPRAKQACFLENLKHKVSNLSKYKNKLVIFGGDTNLDLFKHEHDTHVQDLAEITLSAGYMCNSYHGPHASLSTVPHSLTTFTQTHFNLSLLLV